MTDFLVGAVIGGMVCFAWGAGVGLWWADKERKWLEKANAKEE